MSNKDTVVLIVEALKEERKRISDELYEMQVTLRQFPTYKESIAYNSALITAAEKIIAGDNQTTRPKSQQLKGKYDERLQIF